MIEEPLEERMPWKQKTKKLAGRFHCILKLPGMIIKETFQRMNLLSLLNFEEERENYLSDSNMVETESRITTAQLIINSRDRDLPSI